MIATHNDLEIKSDIISNACVQAPITESEFSKNVGKTAVIVRALYGSKPAEAAFRNPIAMCMKFLGYQSCKADTDLWFKPEIRPEDKVQYYSYLLCYVNNILCVYHNTDAMLEWLSSPFPLC